MFIRITPEERLGLKKPEKPDDENDETGFALKTLLEMVNPPDDWPLMDWTGEVHCRWYNNNLSNRQYLIIFLVDNSLNNYINYKLKQRKKTVVIVIWIWNSSFLQQTFAPSVIRAFFASFPWIEVKAKFRCSNFRMD